MPEKVTRDEKIVDGIELEEGTGQNQGDNIILNGTDSDSSNAGFKLKTELSLACFLQGTNNNTSFS